MGKEYEFTDRYKATNTPYPDPKTVCKGFCEGMGIYPESKDNLNKEACEAKNGRLIVIGQKDEDGKPTKEDNTVFVQCPDCEGTGKNNN